MRTWKLVIKWLYVYMCVRACVREIQLYLSP